MKQSRMLILALSVLIAALHIHGQDLKVQNHGLDIHYRLFGHGVPLLVIGGGPGDVADRYLGLCELLAKNQQCVLVEQRGTGKSAPAVSDASTISVALTLDDFEAIRRQLGLKQWHVLGFSFGGYLASLYAQYFPSSVSALTLLGSMGLNKHGLAGFQDNISSRLGAADLELCEYWSDPQRMQADPQHAISEVIRARMPGYFFDRKKSLLVSQVIKDSDFNFATGDWIWRDIGRQKLDLAEMTPAFSGPVLILHGRQDPLGEAVPLALERYYKKSKLIFIEKCGHYSWVEQPEKVMAPISEFLADKK
jgi:proline iminopeptidase